MDLSALSDEEKKQAHRVLDGVLPAAAWAHPEPWQEELAVLAGKGRVDTAACEALVHTARDARDVNERLVHHNVPLLVHAAVHGSTHLVRHMLASFTHIDCNRRGRGSGMTALMSAARRGHVDVLRALLAHHGGGTCALEAEDTYKHHTALDWAAAGGHVVAARLLVDAGARASGRAHEHGVPTLVLAAKEAQWGVVEMLLERARDADASEAAWWGDTPLMWAAHHDSTAACSLLLRNGADPHARDRDGHTAEGRADMFGDVFGEWDALVADAHAHRSGPTARLLV